MLESTEPDQLVPEAGERGVEPTGIRNDEDASGADAFRFRAGATSRPRSKERAIHGDADEGDDTRLHPRDLPREPDPAGRVLGRRDLGGPARCPGNDIGQGELPRGKPVIVLVRAWLGHELGGVQQAPERIARSREVMAHLRRAERRVDADEEDARPRAEAGGETTHASCEGDFLRPRVRQAGGKRSSPPWWS